MYIVSKIPSLCNSVRHRDRYRPIKNSLLELCRGVHTAQIQIPKQFPLNSIHILLVFVSVFVSVSDIVNEP